ncbi:MAG: hypothetical protein ABI317_13685, partial [Gaiellales bacterium]
RLIGHVLVDGWARMRKVQGSDQSFHGGDERCGTTIRPDTNVREALTMRSDIAAGGSFGGVNP